MSILLRFYILGLSVVALLVIQAAVKKDRETWIRTRTLALLLTSLVLIFAAGQWAVTILGGALAVLSFYELGNLRSEYKKRSVILGWLVGLSFLCLPLLQVNILAPALFAGSVVAFVLLIFVLRSATSVNTTAFAAIALHVVCGLSGLVMMNTLADGFLFGIIFLAQFNDGFAYVTGRAFGRHKLAPVISPKKSVEGAIGGLLATVLAVILLKSPLIPVFADYSWLHGAGLIVITVVFGVGGDLVYSLTKRRAGIKDFASLLPGHGGVLDRMDSLLTMIPIALIWSLWVR